MRKPWFALVAALTLILLILPAAPAAASPFHFSIGTAFSLGPLHFNLVLQSPRLGPPLYFFRTAEPFRDRGYGCSTRCYRDGGHSYHDPHCPALLHHLEAYGYNPYDVFERWAPRYDGSWSDGRYSQRYDRRYDDRYDGRYDGRYDSRYDGRYDRRDDARYRGRYDDRYDHRYDNPYAERGERRAVPRHRHSPSCSHRY